MKKRIFKNTLKLILTAILTIIAYRYAATERGYYLGIIGGGETFIPALCGILFWLLPSMVKEMLRK
ncbi:hypothetical protein [Leptotrichia sp. oral taxon 847]|uniref:hypothetical protein n=1 Tax=Leptotrichia sp. oral taxon 847 TaxID=1785996 RepID=UPI000767DFA6|nr:hypothetical protein [Leptotrichia sp. oral taxon 847]AMD94551.1 hypothetical protein AXF11_02355 [Leptotrichia sp. oral taxon 847]